MEGNLGTGEGNLESFALGYRAAPPLFAFWWIGLKYNFFFGCYEDD